MFSGFLSTESRTPTNTTDLTDQDLFECFKSLDSAGRFWESVIYILWRKAWPYEKRVLALAFVSLGVHYELCMCLQLRAFGRLRQKKEFTYHAQRYLLLGDMVMGGIVAFLMGPEITNFFTRRYEAQCAPSFAGVAAFRLVIGFAFTVVSGSMTFMLILYNADRIQAMRKPFAHHSSRIAQSDRYGSRFSARVNLISCVCGIGVFVAAHYEIIQFQIQWRFRPYEFTFRTNSSLLLQDQYPVLWNLVHHRNFSHFEMICKRHHRLKKPYQRSFHRLDGKSVKNSSLERPENVGEGDRISAVFHQFWYSVSTDEEIDRLSSFPVGRHRQNQSISSTGKFCPMPGYRSASNQWARLMIPFQIVLFLTACYCAALFVRTQQNRVMRLQPATVRRPKKTEESMRQQKAMDENDELPTPSPASSTRDRRDNTNDRLPPLNINNKNNRNNNSQQFPKAIAAFGRNSGRQTTSVNAAVPPAASSSSSLTVAQKATTFSLITESIVISVKFFCLMIQTPEFQSWEIITISLVTAVELSITSTLLLITSKKFRTEFLEIFLNLPIFPGPISSFRNSRKINAVNWP